MDGLLDEGRGIECAIHDNGQQVPAIRTWIAGAARRMVRGHGGETLGAFGVEFQIDDRLAKLLIIHARILQFLTGEFAAAADIVRLVKGLLVDHFLHQQKLIARGCLKGTDAGAAFLGVHVSRGILDLFFFPEFSAGASGALAVQVDQSVTRRDQVLAEQRVNQGLVLVMHHPEFQEGRALNILDRALPILRLEPRQLHHDAVVARLRINQRLCQPHGIHAIADNFHGALARIAHGIGRQFARVHLQHVTGASLQIEAQLDLLLDGRHHHNGPRHQHYQNQPFPNCILIHDLFVLYACLNGVCSTWFQFPWADRPSPKSGSPRRG